MTRCAAIREQLDVLVLGALDGEAELHLREHLSSCVECRELLAVEQALVDIARTMPAQPAPTGFAGRVLQRWSLEEASRAGQRAIMIPASVPELVAWTVAAAARQARLGWKDTLFVLALVWREALRRLVFGGEQLRITLAHVYETTTAALKLTYQFTT